jgi:hypothetical protein
MRGGPSRGTLAARFDGAHIDLGCFVLDTRVWTLGPCLCSRGVVAGGSKGLA